MQPKAVEAAIKEVLSPTLGVTEQILSVHKLVMQNTLPVIARVQDKSDGAYHIYFAVESEPYTRQKNMEPQFQNINNYEKHLTNKGTINNSLKLFWTKHLMLNQIKLTASTNNPSRF